MQRLSETQAGFVRPFQAASLFSQKIMHAGAFSRFMLPAIVYLSKITV